MSLTLHCHPLAAFAQKVLIALYENRTPFKPHIVDLGDPAANAAFKRLWPIGKMPVLRDDARDRTIPESSITWFSCSDWVSARDFHSPQLIAVAGSPAARRAQANVSRNVVVAA